MTQPIIIDCRTPDEYAAGHLAGSRPIDFLAGEFDAAIPELDPAAEYLLYCKSGGRSAHATAMLRSAGIDHATNLGSLEDAAEATGIAIVLD